MNGMSSSVNTVLIMKMRWCLSAITQCKKGFKRPLTESNCHLKKICWTMAGFELQPNEYGACTLPLCYPAALPPNTIQSYIY